MPPGSKNCSAQGPFEARRLAAIAFADIVGYSILVATDETRTIRRWVTILNEVIRPHTAQCHGRIVKWTGDGILAEFPDAFDALEWAQDMQRSLLSEGADGDDQSIVLRIAIHWGEVIAVEADIFGDGVNLAARLQEHAPPGGIVLSEAAYELVGGRLGTRARDLGYLELKNFARPVRAYVLDPLVEGIIIPIRHQRRALPSIAVLPLQNLGNDPTEDYFSEGVVEDITLSLAGLHEIIVISRASALAFRGRRTDPREVGRTLGVRYVLTGTIRRSDPSVRVSVELSDAGSGARLWGEKVEVDRGALFELQDHLVMRIVAGIAPNVRAAELRAAMRKRPENFTAYDHTLRALHVINSLDRMTFAQARNYLDQAMAEDPNFAMPVAWAARWHSLNIGQGWTTSRAEDAAKAVALATRAIELDRDNALALATFGHLKSYLFHDWESGLIYLERALVACPNHSLAWILSSATLSYVGRSTEAIQHAEQALRLSPFDQSLFYYYQIFNSAYYVHGDYEEAVKWGRMSVNENPTYTAGYRFLAAALVALGRADEARSVAAELMRLEPDFQVSVYAETRQPFREPRLKARFLEHLLGAGLPE
jgi:adenylate cyclase